jgi:sugar phosphate isomerase/epimerase
MLTKRPVSLAALTALELDPVEMVRCAAQAGYSHVGLRLVPATPDEPAYDTIGDTPLIRATRAALDDTGVQVLDVEILRLKPETRVADFQPFIETGALLGARHVLIAGNDPDEARLADNFGLTCELAARYGLTANLEPMPWTSVRDIGQAERIIAASGRDDGGIVIDAIHFDRAGSAIGDIASIPPQRFRYGQLCDAPAARPATIEAILFQARAERLAPGAGDLPLRALIGALPAGIPLSLEVPQQALARTVSAVERARRLLQATHALLATL